MIDYFVPELIEVRDALISCQSICAKATEERGQSAHLTDAESKHIGNTLMRLEHSCMPLDLPGTRNLIRKICPIVAGSQLPNTAEVIISQLNTLDKTLMQELHYLQFAYIPVDHVKYFEREKLFGRKVYKAFKSARLDIKEAGNCLAADLNSAAVFHLMRVAEKGMKVLARHLKIKNVTKTKPLTFGTWKEIIRAIKDKIDALYNVSASSKRSEQLEFYGDILNALIGFKEEWRDAVSHERKHYERPDSEKAMIYVSNFMKRLAERISE